MLAPIRRPPVVALSAFLYHLSSAGHRGDRQGSCEWKNRSRGSAAAVDLSLVNQSSTSPRTRWLQDENSLSSEEEEMKCSASRTLTSAILDMEILTYL